MFVICSKRFGGGYLGEPSIFDEIKKDDLIFAFFPCTRFEAKVPLWFRGQAQQQKNWDDIKKLEYSMKLHDELHELYELISMLVVIAERKGLKMIIENPYTQPHYLTTYWCIKPSLIDKNRRNDGDYYENGKLVKSYTSSRKAAADLYCSYQTILDICNGKVKRKPLVDVRYI